jgi:mono/diheme cytochrome c family protein
VDCSGRFARRCGTRSRHYSGYARRGEQLFQTEQCVQCYTIKAVGGTMAPDPARRADRNYTPATAMASATWDHAPEMWAAMKQQGLVRAALTPESAGRLFAYFGAAHYFERPGDAARGKVAFAALHCSVCHGITKSNAEGAPPVAQWESLAEPAALVEQMWNHGVSMRHACAQRRLAWQPLTAQELTDILVYLPNLPDTASRGQPPVPARRAWRGAVSIERLLRLPHAQAGARRPAAQSDPDGNRKCGTTRRA